MGLLDRFRRGSRGGGKPGVVRASDDAATARVRLMDVFDLTEIQANYILELQLRRLTKFSLIELETEKADLERAIEELRALLEEEVPHLDVLVDVVLPYSDGALVSRIYREGEVLQEEHEEAGTRLKARVGPQLAAELTAHGG